MFHFSEDPGIDRFAPHVPQTNPDQAPAVWAIDESHAPAYWFPRDCPRVTAWPHDDRELAAFQEAFGTEATRVHAIESTWAERMASTELFRYEFDARPFHPWPAASGQWIASVDVAPISVAAVGDLMQAHRAAGIDLRIVDSLWPLRDLAVDDRWDFSIIRMANAQPRELDFVPEQESNESRG
ncbi:MAG: DUF6886 family protein [Actinomycetota bacterium]